MKRAAQSGVMTVGDVSALLRAGSDGDHRALERLTPAMRDGSTAKAWLARELTGGTGNGF
jgi:hypothetical protein